MKYLKNKNVIILSCEAPIFGLIFDGIAYLVAKSDTNLHQLPPFMITMIFTILVFPVVIFSIQFIELTDKKIITYLWNIKTYEIELSDVKQWGHYNSIGGRYAVVSYPFIYIANKNFEVSKFNFSKIRSRKFKYIRVFPYDD